jgi:hypothetical protein
MKQNLAFTYEKENGRTEFVHDTLRDFFLAKSFAEKINSEKLSVNDAYVNYWSYVEDKELWGLENLADDDCRAVLPDLKSSLSYLFQMLNKNDSEEFLQIFRAAHLKSKLVLDEDNYLPFSEDYQFAEVLSSQDILPVRHTIIINIANIKPYTSTIHLKPLSRTPNINYSDPLKEAGYYPSDSPVKLLELIKNPSAEVRHAAVIKLDQLEYQDSIENYGNLLIDLLEDDDGAVVIGVKKSLIRIKHHSERLIRLLSHQNPTVRRSAAQILGGVGQYNIKLHDLLDDDDASVRSLALYALGNLGHYDERMFDLLVCNADDECELANRAAETLVELEHYDPRLNGLLDYPNKDTKRAVLYVLGRLKKYDSRIVDLVFDKDEIVASSAIDAICYIAEDKARTIEILRKIKSKGPLPSKGDLGNLISFLHQRLKPIGYNLDIKKLIA